MAGRRGVPETKRQRWITQAWQLALDAPRVKQQLHYVLVSPPPDSPSAYFDMGLIGSNGVLRPSYDALRGWVSSHQRQPRPTGALLGLLVAAIVAGCGGGRVRSDHVRSRPTARGPTSPSRARSTTTASIAGPSWAGSTPAAGSSSRATTIAPASAGAPSSRPASGLTTTTTRRSRSGPTGGCSSSTRPTAGATSSTGCRGGRRASRAWRRPRRVPTNVRGRHGYTYPNPVWLADERAAAVPLLARGELRADLLDLDRRHVLVARAPARGRQRPAAVSRLRVERARPDRHRVQRREPERAPDEHLLHALPQPPASPRRRSG